MSEMTSMFERHCTVFFIDLISNEVYTIIALCCILMESSFMVAFLKAFSSYQYSFPIK